MLITVACGGSKAPAGTGLGGSFARLSTTLFASHKVTVLVWWEEMFLDVIVFLLCGLHPLQIQTTLPIICWYQTSSRIKRRAGGGTGMSGVVALQEMVLAKMSCRGWPPRWNSNAQVSVDTSIMGGVSGRTHLLLETCGSQLYRWKFKDTFGMTKILSDLVKSGVTFHVSP